ncbi:Imm61 family immunity protein [Mycobacterium tilburgii]|uniref:Imm61 family immunity protein n=1 Tax=Mycobacterium tilburgii TaxID=44467 RepID=UPI0028C3C5BD|nr:Imm61 family immunity protein [Mycobacterium tilburgii]
MPDSPAALHQNSAAARLGSTDATNCGRDTRIGEQTIFGRKRHTLIDHAGRVVAIAGVEDLVELSHYLDASVDEIKASYLAAYGKPFFTVWSDA